MRLTVFEQSVLRVGASTDPERQVISSVHLEQLLRLSQRTGLRFLSLGYHSARFEQFVGVLRTGDLEIEILPKLDGAPTHGAIRASLVGMLGETENIRLTNSGVSGLGDESGPFIKALARLYCLELLQLVRRGLPQDYVAHHEILPYVRGKIDWIGQAKLAVQMRAEVSCRFDDRSIDIPLNRTLKQALMVASSFLRDRRWAGLISELRHAMDGVSDLATEPGSVRLDRLQRHLQPLVNLAALLLKDRSTDLSGLRPSVDEHFAALWDMNRLFEEYISVVAARTFATSGVRVEAQSRTHFASETSTNRSVFPIRPDLIGFIGREPIFVGDVKWKRLEPIRETFGVNSTDAFQVAAYARRYGAPVAVLVYPHHPALGRCGVLGEYLIRDNGPDVRLRIVALDLTDLSSVGNQLHVAFATRKDLARAECLT